MGGFLLLLAMLGKGLSRNPNQLDLVTAGQPVPDFSLPALLHNKILTPADLRTDAPYFLINFWGSWCSECYTEHAFLLKLAKTHTIYGVNWKDNTPTAKQFLTKLGNPYQDIIVDANSQMAINMGVYGAPETFLVSADGTMLYRHAGALSEAVWQAKFVPKIHMLRAP